MFFFFFDADEKWAEARGLYYKHVTIVIYDRNDSVQYHTTTIMIVIDDP